MKTISSLAAQLLAALIALGETVVSARAQIPWATE